MLILAFLFSLVLTVTAHAASVPIIFTFTGTATSGTAGVTFFSGDRYILLGSELSGHVAYDETGPLDVQIRFSNPLGTYGLNQSNAGTLTATAQGLTVRAPLTGVRDIGYANAYWRPQSVEMTSPPSVQSFAAPSTIRVLFADTQGRPLLITGTLTTLTSLVVTPLPPAAWLFAAGIMAISLVALSLSRFQTQDL